MRTPVVAAVSCALGVVVGVVAALTVANADDPVRETVTTTDAPVRCADVIDDDVLATLGWSDASARPRDRLGRCEWFGEPGNITAGTLGSSVSDECDEATGKEGFQASPAWLEDPSLENGCVVVNEDGIGLYEVITELGDDVVQVRVAVLEPRPVEDVRAAIVLLVGATAPAFG
jgi:hypothetical protein